MSGLVAEMIQGTGDIAFMLWYCERTLHPSGLEVKCGTTVGVAQLVAHKMG